MKEGVKKKVARINKIRRKKVVERIKCKNSPCGCGD